jgi:hypothetical protein
MSNQITMTGLNGSGTFHDVVTIKRYRHLRTLACRQAAWRTVLPIRSDSPRRVRQISQGLLHFYRYSANCIEATSVTLGELATNAVVHSPSWNAEGRPGVVARPIIVTWHFLIASVFIEVEDFNPHKPIWRVSASDEEGESGRGLLMVVSESSECGSFRRYAGGNVVWCVINDG